MTQCAAILSNAQAQQVNQVAVDSGALILKMLHEPDMLGVQQKPDGSQVTKADFAADAFIKQRLQQITPGIPVLSEEDDLATQREAMKSGTYWCVDPLDGTRTAINYATKNKDTNRFFGPLICLVVNGVPVFGVAHYPVLEEGGLTYFTNAQGTRAWRRQGQQTAQEISVNPLVSQPLRTSIGWRDTHFSRLAGHAVKTHVMNGSRILDVAQGTADVGLLRHGKFQPGYWDIAALQAILQAAGGAVYEISQHAIESHEHDAFASAVPLRFDLPADGLAPFHRHCIAVSPAAQQELKIPMLPNRARAC
ncbi:MAG: 3'(2'),5'-bisphosphate nucleotidase CysQ family protein [Rickettsiales bacterium]